MNEGRKISSHTVSTQIDEAIYSYMTSLCRDRNTAYFLSFFPTKYLYLHFYIKTALYISFMSVQFETFEQVLKGIILGKSISYFILFINFLFRFPYFFYCCCFLFFGRPNVHMKKRKLIYESKKFKLRFLASCRLFSRFARFR